MIEFLWLVFAVVVAAGSLLFLTRPAPSATAKQPRCKMWVPLSYLGTAGTYHSADDTTPHARCCLPADHRPRSVHLVDPVEVRDLNLARVPF